MAIKKNKKVTKKVTKSKKKNPQRIAELAYVKAALKALDGVPASTGTGGILVKSKTGRPELKSFTTKAEAIALLNQVKKGTLKLA